MESKQHWEQVYRSKSPTAVSWFQEHAALSLKLIQDAAVPRSASIIDVGGGASTLVDDLLANGYQQLTVLDLSAASAGRWGLRRGPAHRGRHGDSGANPSSTAHSCSPPSPDQPCCGPAATPSRIAPLSP